MKDLRKFPRYSTNTTIIFLDRSGAEGKMVDASREGSLIITSSKLKPINAYVSFEIHMTEFSNEENDDFIEGEESSQKVEKIKIVGKVVHHTKYKGKDAMGIQFLELSSDDLSNWLQFLGKIKSDQEALPMRVIDEETPENDYPSYTLRFLSRSKLKNFLPSEDDQEMYFSTSKERDKGELINLTLIHPDDQSLLHLVVVVDRYDKHPSKKNKKGLYCILQNDDDIQSKIEDFI